MPRLITAAALLAFLNVPCHAQITRASYAFGKQYVVEVTREALEKSPAWKNDAENPPLRSKGNPARRRDERLARQGFG